MPEYLAPGVYIEETSYRAKSIEGVATSTAGFVGQCLFGPTSGEPVLITSFEEFRRRFGGIEDLLLSGVPTTNYLAHAVKAFFENGGKRVYVSRVFGLNPLDPADTLAAHTAAQVVPFAFGGLGAADQPRFRARFPGRAGEVKVAITATRGGNSLVGSTLLGVRPGDVVEVSPAVRSTVVRTASRATTPGLDPVTEANLHWVELDDDGKAWLRRDPGAARVDPAGFAGQAIQKVSVQVTVSDRTRNDFYADLSTCRRSPLWLGRVLRTENASAGVPAPFDRAARVWFDVGATVTELHASALLEAMLNADVFTLDNGSDGRECTSLQFEGGGAGDAATGLAALAEIDDIAILAAPGAAGLSNATEQQAVRGLLLTQAESLKYRFAILSGDRNLDVAGIRAVRAAHDSSYGALYYPWVVARDPNGQAGDTIVLPPDGFIAGVCARSDIERGVHKAPANEVVRGALRFSRHVDKGTQDVLNPLGINCLRFFEGRGYRVWGARTMSSDPEWKYLNVRRLFIYLEHSIDNNTQWAVFEPNNEELWVKVRMTIESFLTDVWRTGALMGSDVKEAFFVRCDRTTMTQGDLDNGRLVCLIGVAPTKPAEYVIFRIGQWTADASIL